MINSPNKNVKDTFVIFSDFIDRALNKKYFAIIGTK